MRNILTLLAGNCLGTVVGAVFFLSASRNFSLSQMGLYGVAISVQWILAGIAGTGLHVATVRLTTAHLSAGNRAAAAGVVALAAMTASAITLSAAAFCLVLSRVVSLFLPGELLAMAALWAGGRLVLECVRAGLLVQQQYTRVCLLMCLSAITGLGSLGVAFLRGPLTLESLLAAHVFGLGAGAIGGLAFLLPLCDSGIQVSTGRLRELCVYAWWPALSEGSRLVQANIGPFVLVSLAGPVEAGLFSLGRYPAYLFDMIGVSLFQYWLPAAAREAGNKRLVPFLGRQLQLAGAVGLCLLLSAVAVRPFLPWLGSNFAAAASLFVLNALDIALFVLIRPIEAAYHGLRKPHLELLARVSRFPLLLGAALVLAYRFGAVGMVWAQILSNLVALGVASWLLWRELDPGARVQVLNTLYRRG